jgi:hypothetical protein
MSQGMTFNWDNVTVKVKVWTDNGTDSEMQEVELPMETFARLLLTSVPGEWFAKPPISDDLPLHIPHPPLEDVGTAVREALTRVPR